MEFVLLFEDEMKVLTDFLSESKDRLQLSREIGGQRSEEAWEILTEVRQFRRSSFPGGGGE